MKTIILCVILSLLCQFISLAQTPEQQAQIEKAKRQQDSIMNLPHVKEMMDKVKAMEKSFAKQEKERKTKEKPKQKKKLADKATKENDNFYWRKTIASNTSGKIKDWSYGKAIIKASFFDRNKRKYVYLPMGNISKEGQIIIQLPSVDTTKMPFIPITKNYSEGENLFWDYLNYSHKDAKWISSRFTLEVYSGDTVLGTLKMGNSIRPVVNLNSPCCTGKAGDGYAISWVYVTESNSVTGQKKSKKGSLISYDLRFKKGWNLIKIAIDGRVKENVYNTELWKNKRHTALSSLPADAKYFFTKN